MTKNDFGNLRIKAAQAIPVRQREVSDAIDQHVLGGQVRSEEEIREWAAVARLPEEEVTSLYAGLRDVPVNTPETRAAYLKQRSEMMTALASYDATLDSNDEQYYALKRAVRAGYPLAEREMAYEEIGKARTQTATPERTRLAALFRRIDAYAETGWLGGSQQQGTQDARTRYAKALALKDEAARFFKGKPDATPQDVQQHLQNAVKGGGLLSEAARWYDNREAGR